MARLGAVGRRRRRERDEDEDVPVGRGGGDASLLGALELLEHSKARLARQIIEELGTGCGLSGETDDRDVPGGEDPFENATIDDIRDLLDRGQQLAATPWGKNAWRNRACYIAGPQGHRYVVKPVAETTTTATASAGAGSSESQDSVLRVQDYLRRWMESSASGYWASRQSEVCRRLDEHGECLDLLFYEEGRPLRLSFVEPSDLDEDPQSRYQPDTGGEEFVDVLGIRRTNDVLYRPVAYYVATVSDASGQWLGDLEYHKRDKLEAANFGVFSPETRCLVQYRRRNVLSSRPRGLSLFWDVREELRWAKVLLGNLMRVSAFQAAFGAIRTINTSAGADAVKAHLQSQNSGKVGEPAERMEFPSPSVVTVPSSVKYEFPETGAGVTNHAEVELLLLRAVAAGLQLPEFMLTANVSQGNFASTLVSEGPFHKVITADQGQMVTEDLRVVWEALVWGALQDPASGITLADLAAVTIEAKPPTVQTRNRKEDWDIHFEAWKAGRISGKTLNASQGWEYDEEQEQRRAEGNEVEPPMTEHPATAGTPGPDAQRQSDPLAERGVLAGDPGRRTPAQTAAQI